MDKEEGEEIILEIVTSSPRYEIVQFLDKSALKYVPLSTK
jgi:hypothetical protein